MHGPRVSNCLIWALAMWFTRGGYVLFRRGRRSPIPHFIWSGDLKNFWAYEPVRLRRFHPFMFRGRVVRRKASECP